MADTTVLISGASTAGPVLAYWLGRHGFRPTIVEIAPALRTGGNAVDFRGPVHLGLLTKMGVLEDCARRRPAARQCASSTSTAGG